MTQDYSRPVVLLSIDVAEETGQCDPLEALVGCAIPLDLPPHRGALPGLEHSCRQLVDVAAAGKVTPLLCKRKRRGDPGLPAGEEAGERRARGGARVREPCLPGDSPA